jgi:hypothetical protein
MPRGTSLSGQPTVPQAQSPVSTQTVSTNILRRKSPRAHLIAIRLARRRSVVVGLLAMTIVVPALASPQSVSAPIGTPQAQAVGLAAAASIPTTSAAQVDARASSAVPPAKTAAATASAPTPRFAADLAAEFVSAQGAAATSKPQTEAVRITADGLPTDDDQVHLLRASYEFFRQNMVGLAVGTLLMLMLGGLLMVAFKRGARAGPRRSRGESARSGHGHKRSRRSGSEAGHQDRQASHREGERSSHSSSSQTRPTERERRRSHNPDSGHEHGSEDGVTRHRRRRRHSHPPG